MCIAAAAVAAMASRTVSAAASRLQAAHEETEEDDDDERESMPRSAELLEGQVHDELGGIQLMHDELSPAAASHFSTSTAATGAAGMSHFKVPSTAYNLHSTPSPTAPAAGN